MRSPAWTLMGMPSKTLFAPAETVSGRSATTVKLPLTTSRRRTFRRIEAVQVVGPVQRIHAVVTWPVADAGWLMSMVVALRLEFASMPAAGRMDRYGGTGRGAG